MPEINAILTALNGAYSGGADRVNWVSELKPILDNLTNELLLRGIKPIANVAGLAAESGQNFKIIIVTAVGVFVWQSTGTVNGVTVFAAAGGGVWVLVLSSGSSSGSYAKETIEVTAVTNYTINWTSDRLAAYGQWPSIATWIQDGSTWRTALIEWEADDPDEPSQFSANFGGSVNVKIIIG